MILSSNDRETYAPRRSVRLPVWINLLWRWL